MRLRCTVSPVHSLLSHTMKGMCEFRHLASLLYMYRCTHALNLKNDSSIWASARQNLSSGFPTKRDSNQSRHLQRHARNNACSKYSYGAFQKANYKGAEQSARMRRLVCTFVVRKSRRHVFWRRGTTAITTRKSFPDLFRAAPIGTVSSRE